jgi:hypothetical protein
MSPSQNDLTRSPEYAKPKTPGTHDCAELSPTPTGSRRYEDTSSNPKENDEEIDNGKRAG